MDEKETQSKRKFHFKQWLMKCNLSAIENIFRDYKMTTINTLSMRNKNLSKLLSDKRICSNSKLVAMVIVSLQSLDSENTQNHQYPQNARNTQNNQDTQPKQSKQPKIDKIGKIRNNMIPEIEEKLNGINNLENRLKNIDTNYQKHKNHQIKHFKKSKTKYIADLNKSKTQIVDTFSTIYNVLKQKEHSLLTELTKYNVELNVFIDDSCNDNNDDDEKKSNNHSENMIFAEKYKSNQLIINDCKQYITEQLNICKYIDNALQIKEIAKNIDNMYLNYISRFNENEKFLKQQINRIEESKYNINSVSFKLNEQRFSNIIGEIDKIGELLKYKKLEIEIKKVEWSDINHINIYYEFMNIDNKLINSINVQQYEIVYRYFDINMSDIIDIDKFEWKTVLFPSRSITNNKMFANPLNIQIEAIESTLNKSDNDTLIFIKMRVKHNPYYLWSSYSSTFKRKAANFLIVEKGQTISLKLTQKKKKKYRRKSYASTHSSNNQNNNQHSLRSNASSRSPQSPKSSMNASMNASNPSNPHYSSYRAHQSSTDLSNDDQATSSNNLYHQYYTFDSIIIKEGGTLTINQQRKNIQLMGPLNSINSNQSMDGISADGLNLNECDNDGPPKGYLHIVIHQDLIINKGGKIDVSGLGYNGGTRYESGDSVNSFGELGQTTNNKGGGGGSKTYELGCGGGGGYGTNGDNGCSGKGFGFGNNKTKYRENIDGAAGIIYGDELLSVCHFGSGGGGGDYGDSMGGNGGGIIIIECKNKLILNDTAYIQANGKKGKYDSDGCGSGGSIFIKSKYLTMKNNAKIEAIGGKNGLKGNGGNGGDGRIRIKCDEKNIQWNKLNITPRPYIG